MNGPLLGAAVDFAALVVKYMLRLKSRGPGTAVLIALGAAFGIFFGAGSMRPASAADLDMNKIFRCQAKDKAGISACDQARSLILRNCTVCHSFVPIVIQQFDAGAWNGLLSRHRSRVAQLNDAQIAEIRAYLTANFNPTLQPPDLPPELLKEWTSY